MTKLIDSHHHLWTFNEAEFSWLETSLQKSFLAEDLESTLADTGVTQSIAVQARCSLEENDFLIAQAAETDLICGIVGWADLRSDDVSEVLDRLAAQPLMKGIREITQGAADEEFLANDAFDRGVDLLASRGLSYDLLIFEDQLDVADAFVGRHENLPIVLDHCAKPSVRADVFPEAWAKGIRHIAQHENLCCKLSGLVSEVRDGSACKAELFQPYFDTVLEAFGPERIMFGSDWPVSLGATLYASWLETVLSLTSSLSEPEQEMIFRGSAERFYRV
ncbi:amidohydrolase family protein [Verrucomicrobiaceae bacterium R5-34]|nr:amidohydrolase family protein [Verrucomicrobiaceae bacterium R5-34]